MTLSREQNLLPVIADGASIATLRDQVWSRLRALCKPRDYSTSLPNAGRSDLRRPRLALFVERRKELCRPFAGPNHIEADDSLDIAAVISRECAKIVGVGKRHLCHMFPILDGVIGST